MALQQRAHALDRRAADTGVGPDQARFRRVREELLDRDVVDVREHDQVALLGELHQAARGRPVGVAAVVEMELAEAAVRARVGSRGELAQHHVDDRRVGMPAAVVGAVAVQAHERHHRDAGTARVARGSERCGAVVRTAVRDHRAHAALLHPAEHVVDREAAIASSL